MAHEAITLHHKGPRETDSWSRSSAARDELQLASKLNGVMSYTDAGDDWPILPRERCEAFLAKRLAADNLAEVDKYSAARTSAVSTRSATDTD
jgi:hypothetical protein